jgi:hypothetical protein
VPGRMIDRQGRSKRRPGTDRASCSPHTLWRIDTSTPENLIGPVKSDPVISAINRYRAAMAELDQIAVREPTLPNGHPADETEEYALWETASHKAQDIGAAWADLTATQPTTVAGAIALINCYLEVWSEHPIRAEHQASGALKILRSFLRSIAS